MMGRKSQLLISEEKSLAESVQNYHCLSYSSTHIWRPPIHVSNWLILFLRKFDTSLKKENDKNATFIMKNNNKMQKKHMKALSNTFTMNSPTNPWRNMLQTLERWRQYFPEMETIYWYHFVRRTPSFMRSLVQTTKIKLLLKMCGLQSIKKLALKRVTSFLISYVAWNLKKELARYFTNTLVFSDHKSLPRKKHTFYCKTWRSTNPSKVFTTAILLT